MMKLARAQRQDALPLLRLYRLCANQPQSTWNEYYPSPVEVREDLDFGGLYVLRDAHRIVACASLILPEEGAETGDVFTPGQQALRPRAPGCAARLSGPRLWQGHAVQHAACSPRAGL